MRCLWLIVLLLLAGCGAPQLDQFGAACTVIKRAELPLTLDHNFLLAPVWLDKTGAFLVVDTGAEVSLLTPESAARLTLAQDGGPGTTLLGVSGSVHSDNVRLHSMEVGAIHRADLSMTVGALSGFERTALPVSGLLGDDLLARYDVELDVPDHRMALYETRNCTGFSPVGFDAWHHDFEPVRLRRTASGLAFMSVTVDGKPLRALLDSGARSSLMTRAAAHAIGVTDAMLEHDPARKGQGVGTGDVVFRQHRFDRVAIGDTPPHAMEINVATTDLPAIDMLLGADWLATRRVWLPARGTGQTLFVQAP